MNNNKKTIIFILLIILLLSFGFNIYFTIELQNKSIRADNSIQNQSLYLNLVEDINSNFTIDGYREILKDKNYFLCLPLESKETDLPSRQKLFVYKNPTRKCIIFLSITYSKYNSKDNNEWTSSYDYAPIFFNNRIGEYKDSYSNEYPKIQVASNSFNYNGCHISILSFSDDMNINDETSYVAAEELTSFSNNFLNFIDERMNKNA